MKSKKASKTKSHDSNLLNEPIFQYKNSQNSTKPVDVIQQNIQKIQIKAKDKSLKSTNERTL